MSLNIKVVISFLLTQVFGYGAAFASVIVPQTSIELSQTEAHAYKLEKPIYIEKALSVIVAQADTNSSIPAQKRALEQVKNDFLRFFNQYWNDHAINSFSKVYNSYKFFLLGFKSLAVDGVTVKAHHIRSLIRLTEKLLKDLAESIRYNRSEGHSNEEMKALLLLEGLCQQLVKEFLKEGYFLPLTTTEIFKDLLIYRTTELIAENKIATAALAVLVWELLGRKFDPKHEKSYSQPLTTVKELFFKKPVKSEPLPAPQPPEDDQLVDTSVNNNLSNNGKQNFDGQLTAQQRDDLTRDPDNIAPSKNKSNGAIVDVKATDLIAIEDHRPKDKNNKLIPLSYQQACSQVTIDGTLQNGKLLRGIGTDLLKGKQEDRQLLRITQQQTKILTPGQSGKDFIVEDNIPVPVQKDGYSCGPRALWAAEKLLNPQKQEKEEEQAVDSFISETYTTLAGSRTILYDEHLLKFAKTRSELNKALQNKDLLILGSRSKNQVLQDFYTGKYMSEKDRRDAAQIALDTPFIDAIAEFQKGKRPQFIVLLVGQHWITIKLELKSINGALKPAMSVCDGFGGNYAEHPSVLALLYAFTEGTPYQVGKVEEPEEHQWQVLEHLNGSGESEAEKAFIDKAIADNVLFLTDKGLAPLSHDLIKAKVEKDKAEAVRLKKLNDERVAQQQKEREARDARDLVLAIENSKNNI